MVPFSVELDIKGVIDNLKAKELGIPIISEDTFIEMFGR